MTDTHILFAVEHGVAYLTVNRPEQRNAMTWEMYQQLVEIRPEERRLILSLRRLARERERARVKEYISSQGDEGRVTIGDIAGELLRQVVTTPAPPSSDRAPGQDGAPTEETGASHPANGDVPGPGGGLD